MKLFAFILIIALLGACAASLQQESKPAAEADDCSRRPYCKKLEGKEATKDRINEELGRREMPQHSPAGGRR